MSEIRPPRRFVLKSLCAAALMLAALPALAQSVQVLGEYNAWSAYATTQSTGQICFILTRPTATEPEPSGYGDAYFYITHRPGQAVRSEINLVAGYALAPDSPATLVVGSERFALFTQDDAAWLADTSQSAAALQAIRGGSAMSVEGISATGTAIRQNFSLMGATAASREIDAAC